MTISETAFLLYAELLRYWNAPRFFLRLQREAWYRQMLRTWTNTLHIRPGDAVLEVGCGPGLLSIYLAQQGTSVIGFDRSVAMILAATQAAMPMHFDVIFESGDAHSLPYANASFSHVISSSLINIVSSPIDILREMSRVTRPGGTLSLLVPAEAMTLKTARSFARSNNLKGPAYVLLLLWSIHAPKMTQQQVTGLIREVVGLQLRHINYDLGGMVLVADCTREG